MEALTSFIVDNYPSIAFMISGIIIGGLANKYRTMLTDTKKKVSANTKRIDSLPCDNHRRAIVNIEKTLSEKKRFNAIMTYALSPRKLSEIGRELYQKSGIETLLDENIERYISEMESINPSIALDVEDLAYSVLFNDTSNPIFKPVKDWLFNNPIFYELDIDMITICYVASIELRDRYLENHPEIIPSK